MYHEGSRRLQEQFETTGRADRLEQLKTRAVFTDDDKAFIETRIMFLLASADAQGRPTCSYKGGLQGFVRVVAPDKLVFPDYEGNGMFLSMGNISVNPNVGLLFIDFEKPRRLRVDGTAVVSRDDPLVEQTLGTRLIVRVKPRAIFPNCPRNVPNLQFLTAPV